MEGVISDLVLDCRGEYCPLPVLHTRQAMDGLAGGQVLELWVDDRAAEEDIQRWAKRTGHHILNMRWEDGHLVFHIRKAH